MAAWIVGCRWLVIEDVFSKPKAGRPPMAARRVMDGICWILRAGRRGDLPETRAVKEQSSPISIGGPRIALWRRRRPLESPLQFGRLVLTTVCGRLIAPSSLPTAGVRWGRKRGSNEPEDRALGRSRGVVLDENPYHLRRRAAAERRTQPRTNARDATLRGLWNATESARPTVETRRPTGRGTAEDKAYRSAKIINQLDSEGVFNP